MLPPVRCFTCGAPLGHLWEKFRERVAQGEPPSKVLDDLGVRRYCCRRMLYTAVTYIEQVARYDTPSTRSTRVRLYSIVPSSSLGEGG